MPLPATTFASALGLNTRARLLWNAGPGAAAYNLYRNGTLLRAGLPINLFIDFGLTNGTAYSYTVAGVDAQGVEGAQSPAAAVTPAPPSPTQFRYRQVLGNMLRYLVVTDAVPAINAAFAADQAAKGLAAPLLTLTEAQALRGTSYAVGDPTICVDVMGSRVVERFSEGLSSLVFHSQVQFLLPSVTGNRPEDRSFAGDVVMDGLHAVLGAAQNSVIPSLSPKSGNWMLPGCGTFRDCRPTQVLRISRPVEQADVVTRVPAWLLLHESTIEVSQSDLAL
jgi:hypothetical protein